MYAIVEKQSNNTTVRAVALNKEGTAMLPQMNVIVNEVEVHLVSVEGKVFANSLDVAKVFEKKHIHVMEKIRSFSERGLSNFRLSSYANTQNKSQPMYEMNRDGFMFLAMGFTGEKAENWKLDLIDAFNQMEEAIRNPQIKLPTSPMEIMALMFEAQKDISQQVIEVKQDVLELKATSTLDYAQQLKIQKQVAIKVAELKANHNLGADSTPKLFKGVQRHLKNQFEVVSYKDIPKVKFNEAVQVIQSTTFSKAISA